MAGRVYCFDASGVDVDPGNGGTGAVEHHDAVVVAGGDHVVPDGEVPLADGHVVAEDTGGCQAAAGAVVEVVDVGMAGGNHEMVPAGLPGVPPVVDELFPDLLGGSGV